MSILLNRMNIRGQSAPFSNGVCIGMARKPWWPCCFEFFANEDPTNPIFPPTFAQKKNWL